MRRWAMQAGRGLASSWQQGVRKQRAICLIKTEMIRPPSYSFLLSSYLNCPSLKADTPTERLGSRLLGVRYHHPEEAATPVVLSSVP